MWDAPIGAGADLFIWIVCILGGFVAGLMAIDTYQSDKKKEDSAE